MGLSLAPDSSLKLRPAGSTGGIFGRKCLCFFPARVLHSCFVGSLMARNHQSKCCAPVLDNCDDYHCNRVLEL
jgi:hypothetical protein